jgi:Second Messenger Oligonucleotide or Dinucleotide Synthetase domain
MTLHEYLISVLNNQKMRPEDLDTLQRLREEIESALRRVFGSTPRFYYGGSYGKDTLIRESFDLDIVMYFPSTERRTLAELYGAVYRALLDAQYKVTPKNVALRLPYQGGFHIDVVPGKAQDTTYRYATLYKSEENSTRQTSIKIHIDSVRRSGMRDIIKLMKLWRFRHGLDWQSFALEQTVLRALAGKRISDYGTSVWTVLQFIRDNIMTICLVDPANSNNKIEMSPALRAQLLTKASLCLAAHSWNQIIW